MTPTKISISFNQISRMADLGDLAELLFPRNPNQQHAFLVIWFSLKWHGDGMVPNLGIAAKSHGVSRRTLERVRAKMRRLGVIDHVSRFNARHGYREGWILSARFERSLARLAKDTRRMRDSTGGNREKDEMLIHLVAARRKAIADAACAPDEARASQDIGGEVK